MKAYDSHHPQHNKNIAFPCPHCKKPSRLSDNVYKPFCSERCKLIDLGAWANEAYKVAADDTPMGSELNRP